MDIIEGHPIPQDITGFQFRIIGDLTIKQFGYLAVGLVLGWVFFSIPMPFIIRIPLAVLVAGTGILFAFVPIQGRPADTMLMLFIRAVLNANEYTYQKQQAALPTATQQVPSVTKPAQPIHAPTPPAVTDPVLHQPVPATNATPLSVPANGTPADPPADQEAHAKTLELAKQLEDTRLEKQKLEEQLLALQQQMQQKPQQVYSPSQGTQPTPNVKTVPEDAKKSTGIPLAPDVPNLILGVVKDPRGNILPNILIEVKDKDGNPVRAFKTNPLGQFASATPLLNGTYVISFEDPKQQQQFDTITITADGTIIPPLEVTSVDERENLRKSLFGG